MIHVQPVVLRDGDLSLEPLQLEHAAGLAAAAADGALWTLHFTSVPAPGEEPDYIAKALQQQAEGSRLPWVVTLDGEIVGSTSFHDIVPAIDRLEIGYTWYAKRHWRSSLNTRCKLLLMAHAFDDLGAQLVGWRTDILNGRSQAAIERLGARKDGVLRHHMARRDGTVRDTVMYSMTAAEWPAARAQLLKRLR